MTKGVQRWHFSSRCTSCHSELIRSINVTCKVTPSLPVIPKCRPPQFSRIMSPLLKLWYRSSAVLMTTILPDITRPRTRQEWVWSSSLVYGGMVISLTVSVKFGYFFPSHEQFVDSNVLVVISFGESAAGLSTTAGGFGGLLPLYCCFWASLQLSCGAFWRPLRQCESLLGAFAVTL